MDVADVRTSGKWKNVEDLLRFHPANGIISLAQFTSQERNFRHSSDVAVNFGRKKLTIPMNVTYPPTRCRWKA